MLALYARGGIAWPLGFVALVPWLHSLDPTRGWRDACLDGWALSIAYTLAVLGWFANAIARYTHTSESVGLLVLVLAAPALQPQALAFTLVRWLAGRRHGPAVRAAAACAAWVAAEGLLHKTLGDTLGHGLYPATWLRQAADLGGAAGLTLALLGVNEALARALARRADGARALARPLALAAAAPLLMASYGAFALAHLPPPDGPPLRIGLVQSALVDYDDLKRTHGSAGAVRDVLDLHYAMSHDAVTRLHAQAVLWSETVYPTTFGHPKSALGADFDREILGVVRAAGVPFVFGTFDRDAAGEYNAAAFVTPDAGLLGFYRKTRLFPFTEHVPAWLDGPTLRRWLPWAGAWQPGSGARVFPLDLADGREVPVLPLICLDDVDPQLAIDGARLGARAIVTLSNDGWFSDVPEGARLHLAVAAFRSIETRLPQFRVTTNGYSAIIDRTGRVLAGTRMGERTLVIGEAPVGRPPATLMRAWGDWVGRAAALALLLLAAAEALRRLHRRHGPDGPTASAPPALPAKVSVLPAPARLAAGVLRAFARTSLVAMGAVIVATGGDAQLARPLTQIRDWLLLFAVPEGAAACVLFAYAARATLESGALVLRRGAHRLELPLHRITQVRAWWPPLPAPGAALRVDGGARWRFGLAGIDPVGLRRALREAGAALAPAPDTSFAWRCALARQAARPGRLDRPWVKYGLLPLALALPAFRLHEHIAYGGTFGEYYTFGLAAYLTTLALWWAAWTIGVTMGAAALRLMVEAATLACVLAAPRRAAGLRRALEILALATLYVGLPALLLWRVALA